MTEVKPNLTEYSDGEFDISNSYTIKTSTVLSIGYCNDNKLKLYDITNNNLILITTALLEEDGNPVTISMCARSNADNSVNINVPSFVMRYHSWEFFREKI